MANAAVWFGASIFFTFSIAPAFFSEPMLRLFGGANLEIGRNYAGEAAQIIIARYFNLHLVCGMLALLHLTAEWLYMGKPLQRLTLWLLLGIFALGLTGGFVIQPKLHGLHRTMVDRGVAAQLREEASRSFKAWHGASQVINLVALAGITVYLWRATTPGSGYRYRA